MVDVKYYKPEMKWGRFLLLLSLAILLFASWQIELTRAFWDIVDKHVFYFLNAPLATKPFSQIFWALTNIRTADLFGAIFVICFFVLYAKDGSGFERRKRIAEFLYLCIWGEIGILISKEVLGPALKYFQLTRVGPTMSYDDGVMLSKAIPWLKVKDVSLSCFPSDHGIILLQWLFFIFFFCPWRYRLAALFWILFFCLPRLVSGAHWLSDILVGSVSYVCIIMAFALYTPIYGYVMNFLVSLVAKFPKFKKYQSTDL